MRTKSKLPPKTAICVRLKQKTIKKVDEICQKKEEQRSEFIRKIIENTIENY